ncbi:hypothetical protein MRX96_048694 [Rhipicephalus microplus]
MPEKAMSLAMSTASPKYNSGFDYVQLLRGLVNQVLSRMSTSLLRKLLKKDVRPECTAGLLRTLRGFWKLEPWALRLFDASGKYPTGLLEGTHVDLGAFDECLHTIVHDDFGNVTSQGQYCNLLIYINNSTAFDEGLESFSDVLHPALKDLSKYFSDMNFPVLRLAICLLSDCNQRDLQTIVMKVTPSFLRLQVSNCVTEKREPWNKTKLGTVALLCILFITVIAATCVDCFANRDPKGREIRSGLSEFVTAFSATSNTRLLLKVADKAKPDHYDLQFLHGIRFYSIVHIVMGHCSSIVSDIWSGMINSYIFSKSWSAMILAAGFSTVDTFFFSQVRRYDVMVTSGFFLCFTVTKQKENGPIVFIVGVTRRLIRTCVPLFFLILCLYGLEAFVNGPTMKTFFENLRNEVSSHWWQLLLQTRNFYPTVGKNPIPHAWYLSADFQLFIVSLLTLLVLRRRRKTLVLTAFAFLSLLSCAGGVCVVASLKLPPFMIFPGPSPDVMMRTADEYYIRPYYHAVCYFGGCITYLIKEDFREARICKVLAKLCTLGSDRLLQAGWCGCVTCGLFCVFVKFAWVTSFDAVPQGVTLSAAFFDRILWTLFLAWITLACSTGRGGVLTQLLSWNAYVPLSKLSFGVYLIHVPFLNILFDGSRERMYWSMFNQVTLLFALLVWCFLLSYLAFLVCEAPTAGLEKVVFARLMERMRKKERTNWGKTHAGNIQSDGGDSRKQDNAQMTFFRITVGTTKLMKVVVMKKRMCVQPTSS